MPRDDLELLNWSIKVMDDWDHKYKMFLTHFLTYGAKELKRRLGLKDWEYEYFIKRKQTEAKRFRAAHNIR